MLHSLVINHQQFLFLLFDRVYIYQYHLQCESKQDAQLSQRDRAAGCIIVFAKSRTLELGDNDLRTL